MMYFKLIFVVAVGFLVNANMERYENEPGNNEAHENKWSVLMNDLHDDADTFKKVDNQEKKSLKAKFIEKLLKRWIEYKKEENIKKSLEKNEFAKNNEDEKPTETLTDEEEYIQSKFDVTKLKSNDLKSNEVDNSLIDNVMAGADPDEDEADYLTRLTNHITEGLLSERDQIKVLATNMATLSKTTDIILDMMANISMPVDESAINI